MKNKYWYYRYIGECPVCGSDKSYKERRFTPKPNIKNKTFNELHGLTFEYIPDNITYDWCEI